MGLEESEHRFHLLQVRYPRVPKQRKDSLLRRGAGEKLLPLAWEAQSDLGI